MKADNVPETPASVLAGGSMCCPKCGGRTDVKDSRPIEDRNAIRRRRYCRSKKCAFRFTTWEVIGTGSQSLSAEGLRRFLDSVTASVAKLRQSHEILDGVDADLAKLREFMAITTGVSK